MIETRVKTKEGLETITAYSWSEVQLPVLNFKPIQRNHKVIRYASDFITLDTETSYFQADTREYEEYKYMLDCFRMSVKGQIINISKNDLKSYGLTDLKVLDIKRNLSYIGLQVSTKIGSKIDTIWDELCTASGNELIPFTDNPADQIEELMEYSDHYYKKTSKLPEDKERCWIYQWAVKIKNTYIYGRKPSEIIELLRKIAEHYKLNDKKNIIIFIHNMSYDIQYLKNYLNEYDPTMEVLATDTHALIQCKVFGFKILCSYRMTNMSLANLSKHYAEKYIKAVGEIDYSITRFQDEDLTYNDWLYMMSDVASQYDGICGYIKSMGYNYAYEVPMTSTGFVRASCRKASKHDHEWRDKFVQSALDLPNYKLCNQAFMGGVCICSYRYAGRTIRSDKLGHKDFTSSYPARQIIDYMPEGAPMKYGIPKSAKELEYVLNTYCCIFLLTLFDVHIKEGITAPYIPSSKCLSLEEGLKVNGKVVFAKKLTIAVCEIDFEIIRKQYTVSNFGITDLTVFKRGKIPEWLKNEIMLYFTNKCTKKGSDQAEYMRSKALLNSIYGMTATALIRPKYVLGEDLMINLEMITEEAQEKELNKYYRSYNSFMPYQYSIYTTAHARRALFELIECVGYDNFLYCDTDSVFYIKTEENEKQLNEYTEKCIQRAIQAGAYVGNKYLGVPEDEAPLRAFRGLHAKCYAMEELDDDSGEYKLQVVVAGIPKKTTKWIDGESITISNAEELKSIDNLKDGFTFSHNGGSRAIYIERDKIEEYIDGHLTEHASGVIIDMIEKEISDTMWSVDNGKLQKILYMNM